MDESPKLRHCTVTMPNGPCYNSGAFTDSNHTKPESSNVCRRLDMRSLAGFFTGLNYDVIDGNPGTETLDAAEDDGNYEEISDFKNRSFYSNQAVFSLFQHKSCVGCETEEDRRLFAEDLS